MSDKKHTLDSLFALAKQQEPLLTSENVHKIVNNAPTTAFPGKQLVNYFKNNLNFWIMTTIVSSLIITVYFIANIPHEPLPAESIEIRSKDSQTPEKGVIAAEIGNFRPEKDFKDDFLFMSNDQLAFRKIDKDDSLLFNTEPIILQLSDAELRNLGFELTDSSASWSNIDNRGRYTALQYVIKPNETGFYPNATFWSIIKRESFTSNDYFPCAISHYPMTWAYRVPYVDLSSHLKDAQIVPKGQGLFTTNENFLSVLRKTNVYFDTVFDGRKVKSVRGGKCPDFLGHEADEYTNKYMHGKDNLVRNFDQLASENFKIFEELNDTLVPVMLKHKSLNCLLWFNSTSKFFENLPSRYKYLQSQIERVKQIKAVYRGADLIKYPSIYNYKNKIEGIKPIVLNGKQLEKFGLRYDSDMNGYVYRDSFTQVILTRDRFSFGEKPSIISDSLEVRKKKGNVIFFAIKKTESYVGEYMGGTHLVRIKPRTSTLENAINWSNYLVPILIKRDAFDGMTMFDDVTLWCIPSDKLYSMLPDTISKEVKQEYHIIEQLHNPLLSAVQKASLPTTCKYFEECRSNLDNVSVNIWPVPTPGNLNLELELDKPMKLMVSIYSASGYKLLSLVPLTKMSAGKIKYEFDIQYFHNGIYLISVQNEKGEFKTQRVIKQ